MTPMKVAIIHRNPHHTCSASSFEETRTTASVASLISSASTKKPSGAVIARRMLSRLFGLRGVLDGGICLGPPLLDGGQQIHHHLGPRFCTEVAFAVDADAEG